MTEQRPDRYLGSENHRQFWQWCDKRELRLQSCRACGQLTWPVVDACEHCGHDTFDWQRISGRGTLAGWTSFERDYYAGVLPLPWEAILVELAEGPLFLSNPVGFSAQNTALGQDVTVTFIDCADSTGPYKLPVFAKRGND